MTSTTIASEDTRTGVQHYLGMAARAAVLGTVINLAIYALGRLLFNLPFMVPIGGGTELGPLPVVMIVVMSVVPAFLAAAALLVLNRMSRHGLRIFQVVATVLALLSLVGPIAIGVDAGTTAALSAMHIVALVAIVGVFTAQSPRTR